MSRSCSQPTNGLKIIDRRLSRAHRVETVFANLSTEASEDLAKITLNMSYGRGTQLFAHHQAALGVYIIRSGQVNLVVTSGQGQTLIFGVAGPGDLLGLRATVSGKAYRAVAEVLEAGEIGFIPRIDFLNFLARHGEVAVQVAKELCDTCDQIFSIIESTGLTPSAAARFARFLLECPSERCEGANQLGIKLPLTQEKIAQIVGTRRETVARILADFKRMQVIEVRDQTIIILNRGALELIAGREQQETTIGPAQPGRPFDTKSDSI